MAWVGRISQEPDEHVKAWHRHMLARTDAFFKLKPQDEHVRAWHRDGMMQAWLAVSSEEQIRQTHCGDRGLAGGCPVCGKEWPA